LKARALRLLAGRDYGREELARKLRPHAASDEALQAVLDELQAKDLLSDERAAAALLRRRADKLGATRVLAELRQKGFAADLIAAQAGFLGESEETRLKTVWEKKFGQAPVNRADQARQMRFLASRGFASAQIASWMRQLGLQADTKNEMDDREMDGAGTDLQD